MESALSEEVFDGNDAGFDLLFHQNPLPMLIYDIHTQRFLEANVAAIRFYGYSREEFLSLCTTHLRSSEQVSTIPTPALREERHVSKDGRVFDVEVHYLRAIFRGRPASVVCVCDVTSHKQGKVHVEKLLTQELTAQCRVELDKKRSSLLTQASGIFGRAQDLNQAFYELSRSVVSEVADWCAIYLVDDERQTQCVAAAHYDPAKLAVAEFWKSGSNANFQSLRPIHRALKDGETFFAPQITPERLSQISLSEECLSSLKSLGVESYVAVPMKVRGQVYGAISFVSSRPQRIFSGEDIHLFEELAQRAALLVENAKFFQDAQQAIRVRDEFLSIAAHELKTPLTAMQAYLEFMQIQLRKESPGFSAEQIREMLSSAANQGRRMIKLINNLLDVARVRAGRFEIRPEKMDFVRVALDVLRRLEPELKAAGCEVRFSSPESVQGRWDLSRIEQVVTNLISNACKYGRGRPIELRIEAQENGLRMSVRDFGIGIPPEKHAKIFNRFERAANAKDFSGLGLGLYIVKQIIEAHQGLIYVESSVGEGSTFVIELATNAV